MSFIVYLGVSDFFPKVVMNLYRKQVSDKNVMQYHEPIKVLYVNH